MQRALFVASTVMAAAAAMTSSAAAQCVTGGTGGNIPADAPTGSGDGTWSGTLPSQPMVGTLGVGAIASGNVLNSVVLRGVSHTWIGDVQFVLQDPSGAKHNILHRIDFTGTGFGCTAGPVGVDLDLRDPVGSNACGGPSPLSCGNVTSSGTYQEYIGNWPSGAIDNVPLESIPSANFTGLWTLYAYDWFPGDYGSISSWDLCFGPPTTPPPPGNGPSLACVTGGGSGGFPTQFTVDGTWPSTLPPGELVAPLAVTVPPGATKIMAVKLHGFAHTWLGDAQIVLQAPSGQKYNLFQAQDGNFGGGCANPVSGDYTIVDATVGLDSCGNAAQNFTCNGTPAGDYRQAYGLWPTGSSGIDNTDLESIPIAAGTWNLICYDWYVAVDDGSLASWDLCFDAPTTPTAYCTAGTSTNLCVPSISASAQPSVSLANACTISITNLEGQKFGIIFYGVNNSGFTPAPWALGSTSFLCVKGPTQRTPSSSSGGTLNACNGALSLNWNAYQVANPLSVGNPWSAGDKVYVQGWYRDPPAAKTTNLSNALELTVQP
jgi:hypothetical protein